jgi:hypothetical protein
MESGDGADMNFASKSAIVTDGEKEFSNGGFLYGPF